MQEFTRRHSPSRGGKLFKWCVILAAFTLGFWFWQAYFGVEPGQALAKALTLIEAGKLDEARPLLWRAKRDPRLEPWAALAQADILTLEKELEKAANLYRAVPESSAASLDAQIGLLTVAPHPAPGSAEEVKMGAAIPRLELKIIAARRTDLLKKLYFLKARAAERSGELAQARHLYHQTRERFSGSEAARMAKTALESMDAAASYQESKAELLEEAALLLKENEPAKALAKVQQVKSNTVEGSEPYFEIMLSEEQVLRKLGRNQEADHMLAEISAKGSQGTADRALYKMIKNAWNENEHSRALEFLANFKKRFPKSSLVEDALYTEGRILEEKNSAADARAIYRQLVKRSGAALSKLQALRQIAWTAFREGSLFETAESFDKAQSASKTAFEARLELRARAQSLPPDAAAAAFSRTHFDKLYEAYLHSKYWRAFVLSELDENALKRLSLNSKSRKKTYRELAIEAPSHYYGLLAAQQLESSAPENPFLRNLSGENRSQCFVPVPISLTDRLRVLKDAGLPQLAQYEIDWFFAQAALLGTEAKDQSTILFRSLTKVRLYAEYSHINRSIGFADSLLSLPQPLNDYGEKHALCAPALVQLSFPRPYRDDFQAAAKANKVPLSLLFALTRTESHFKPQARSSKDARGLMQLLPSTAKEEGLKPDQDLFDPQVNIALGAKHFSRLLRRYQGEKIYAIAAYNAGGSAVNRWRKRYPELSPLAWVEMIGYPETKNYVKKVMRAELHYLSLLN